MDGDRFDLAVRALTDRRSLLGMLAAGVALVRSGAPVSARRHHHHHSCTTQICFGFCIPDLTVCCSNPAGRWCNAGETCCPPTNVNPQGGCAQSPNAVCCSTGGWCDPGSSCCPPEPDTPEGFCADPGWKCCTPAEGGGACMTSERCCPPTRDDPEGYCVDAGASCDVGFAAARERSGQVHRKRFVPRKQMQRAH